MNGRNGATPSRGVTYFNPSNASNSRSWCDRRGCGRSTRCPRNGGSHHHPRNRHVRGSGNPRPSSAAHRDPRDARRACRPYRTSGDAGRQGCAGRRVEDRCPVRLRRIRTELVRLLRSGAVGLQAGRSQPSSYQLRPGCCRYAGVHVGPPAGRRRLLLRRLALWNICRQWQRHSCIDIGCSCKGRSSVVDALRRSASLLISMIDLSDSIRLQPSSARLVLSVVSGRDSRPSFTRMDSRDTVP